MIWHALAVAPGRERRAELGLRRLGLITCLPITMRYRKSFGKLRRPILVPYRYALMPGYVLIGSTDPMPWPAVRKVKGVRGPVMFDGLIGTLTSIEVDRIRAMSKTVASPSRRTLQVGDAARVTDGPFIGFESLIRSIRGDAVTVSLRLFGRDHDVEMPAHGVERAA